MSAADNVAAGVYQDLVDDALKNANIERVLHRDVARKVGAGKGVFAANDPRILDAPRAGPTGPTRGSLLRGLGGIIGGVLTAADVLAQLVIDPRRITQPDAPDYS